MISEQAPCSYIVSDGRRCSTLGAFRLTVELAGYDCSRMLCEQHLQAVTLSRRVAGRNVRIEPQTALLGG